jgi:hypothetical protein
MYSYIYSKWKTSPAGSPVEFYSELDAARFETRKVEIFKNGKFGFASGDRATEGTRLGTAPVPLVREIRLQPEFEVNEINPQDFEKIWKMATAQP